MNIKINIRNTLAITVPLLCFIISVLLVISLSDPPIKNNKKIKNKDIAALAIKDSVIPFMKFGSKLFTIPYLEKHYDEYHYFSQNSKNDQKEEIINCLERLLNRYEHVDIFILAHTNNYRYYVADIDSSLRSKIRLVYNTGCKNASQSEFWLDLGVESYIGHVNSESWSPFFYFYFFRRWINGTTLKDAVNEANIKAKKNMTLISYFHPNYKVKKNSINPKAELFGNNNIKFK